MIMRNYLRYFHLSVSFLDCKYRSSVTCSVVKIVVYFFFLRDPVQAPATTR